MSKIFKRFTTVAMAGVMAMCMAVTASAVHFPEPNHPCNNTYYTLGDNVRVGLNYGTHNYTCTVSYYAYRHTKWCASCHYCFGEGRAFNCREEHTCGNYYKYCVGIFND